MKRPMQILLLLAAVLTASCGLKIDMPTLGSGNSPVALAMSTREFAP